MRRGVAIAALTAGFVATAALPAAAQGWGYADEPVGGVGVSVGFGSPGYHGYAADYPAGYYGRPAYAYGPGGCSCAPAAGYGSAGYGYGGYAYQPGYAYSSSYAYEPGYAYGEPVGYRSYGYDSGPRYARGEFRETTGTRSEIRSGGIAREQGVVRTGARAQAVGTGVRERGASTRTGANVRSETSINQGRTGMSARGANARGGNAMGGEATVGRGGAAQPAAPGDRGEAIGGQGGGQPGMR